MGVAWDKVDRGFEVEWCGTMITCDSATTMSATLPEKFSLELHYEAESLLQVALVGQSD